MTPAIAEVPTETLATVEKETFTTLETPTQASRRIDKENSERHDDALQKAKDVCRAVKERAQLAVAATLPKMTPSLVASLMPVTGLKPHPLSVRVYGEPTASEELLRSVKEIGVVQPIVIDEDNFILAGTSRHFAAVTAGQTEIPAVLFKGSSLEREWLVLESNRQRVKLPSQLGMEFNERFRLEQEFAKLRMAEGGKHKGTPQMADVGEAREKAARAINLGRTTAERLGKIVRKAEDGNHAARHFMNEIDAGNLSIAAAFAKLEEGKNKPKPVDCPRCGVTLPSMTQAVKHGSRKHGVPHDMFKRELGFESEVQHPKPTYKDLRQEQEKANQEMENLFPSHLHVDIKGGAPLHVLAFRDLNRNSVLALAVFLKDFHNDSSLTEHPVQENSVSAPTRTLDSILNQMRDAKRAAERYADENFDGANLKTAGEVQKHGKAFRQYWKQVRAAWEGTEPSEGNDTAAAATLANVED